MTRMRKQSVAMERQQTSSQQTAIVPAGYVLCERSSGAVRFRIEADSDGSVPVEKMAGLLAVHCLVRGQTPEDFELMVITRESLLHPVAERVQQLLEAGRALGTGVRISRREQNVLDGVVQNLANKEIAAQLKVSERTVKFHVSSLLAKFGVTDRIALSREVRLGRAPTRPKPAPQQPQSLFGFPVRTLGTQAPGSNENAGSVPSRGNRVVSLPGPVRYGR